VLNLFLLYLFRELQVSSFVDSVLFSFRITELVLFTSCNFIILINSLVVVPIVFLYSIILGCY